jgi:hypothetical protein
MLDDGNLTNDGVHQLFTDKFEGQRFTLQILKLFPPDVSGEFIQYSQY